MAAVVEPPVKFIAMGQKRVAPKSGVRTLRRDERLGVDKALSAFRAMAYARISGTGVAGAVPNGGAKILFPYSIANAYEHDSHLLCAVFSIMLINRNIGICASQRYFIAPDIFSPQQSGNNMLPGAE